MASAYALLRDRVVGNRGYAWNLDHAFGEHAIAMVNFIRSTRKADDWENVERANRMLVTIVADGEHPESVFRQTVSNLISVFSIRLFSIITQDHEFNRLDDTFVQIARFYSKLGNRSYDDMKKHWVDYAGSVVRMANVAESHGKDSESFFICASDCVRSGQLLGRWLDYAVFDRR